MLTSLDKRLEKAIGMVVRVLRVVRGIGVLGAKIRGTRATCVPIVAVSARVCVCQNCSGVIRDFVVSKCYKQSLMDL